MVKLHKDAEETEAAKKRRDVDHSSDSSMGSANSVDFFQNAPHTLMDNETWEEGARAGINVEELF